MLGAAKDAVCTGRARALGGAFARMECNESTALEASVSIPGGELALLEGPRIDMSLRTADLILPKTTDNYDFSF